MDIGSNNGYWILDIDIQIMDIEEKSYYFGNIIVLVQHFFNKK